MDMLDNMNRAMQYIEQNLEEQIEIAALAQIAGCSAHHFARMFSFIAGVPLAEYIRRRRLSAAAMQLQAGEAKVIDVALRYGYDSAGAFSRAFLALHGIPPTKAKQKGAKLKAYPVMSFHLLIKGDVQMNYRIIEKQEMIVSGLKQTMPLVNGDEDFEGIAAMWAGLTPAQTKQMLNIANIQMEGLLGASANNNGATFDYYIGCTTPKDADKSLHQLRIPAATWGVFEAVGPLPGSIVNTWKRIFAEWFPASGYQSTTLPTLEIYSEGDSAAEDYTCELWVPIVKL